MNFDYTEEQTLLADSVRKFVEKEYDFESRKKMLKAAGTGSSARVWAQFAEMGLLAMPLPLEYDGFGGGAVDLIGVMEAFGEGLVSEPYVATVILGARTVALAGSAAQKAAILPKVAVGSLKLALAISESKSRYNLDHCETRAVQQGSNYTLNGKKMVVQGAPEADKIIVSARVAGTARDNAGLSLFLVDARAAGVKLDAYRTFDDLSAGDITLTNVQVAGSDVLGEPGRARAVIDEVMDFANAVSCAEAVGAMEYANKATLEYIKTRKQFGQPIGAFQALQHRMVDMTISAIQARSMVYLACTSVNGELGAAERSRRVAAAKIRVADAARHISQEAVQLHGGMGMTEELKVSHTFRRLTMLARRFGDADYYLDRFELGGAGGA
jgi:alkylation response protein AidB-like acyl-CoA dehydrogenase